MKITRDNLQEIVNKLAESWDHSGKEVLLDIYNEHGSLFCAVKVSTDFGEVDVHTHHTLGRTIRNQLIDIGVDPVSDNGIYLLDEIWVNIAEMALGVREASVEELHIQEYLYD